MPAASPVALYYPHTTVNSESLLKTGLLLWDSVDCIVPTRNFVREARRASKARMEAEELLIRHRVPSEEEKKSVHRRIEQMLANGVPPWLYQELKGADSRHYLVYPEKLAHATWQLLEGVRLAELVERGGRDYRVPPALGLLLMSMLADECAGNTRTKVTDRTKSYAWLMGTITHSLGGEYLPQLEASQLASTYDRFMTASVHVVSADGISLQKLLEMRRREAAGGSSDYREFRRAYLERVSGYVQRLATAGQRTEDAREIERQHRLEMEADLRELKRELRLTAGDVLVSKEVGVAVLAAAGSTVTPVAGLLGVGALVHTAAKYRHARRAVLKRHATSWLYLAKKG